MRFYIDKLLVLFPYEFIYPEQLEYMKSLKEGLDKRGHLVLEMPSGTGKTISILSLVVAYWAAHSIKPASLVSGGDNNNNSDKSGSKLIAKKSSTATPSSIVKQEEEDQQQQQQQQQQEVEVQQERIRIVYCTRTVAEMVKAAGELKRLVEYWNKYEPGKLESFTGVCMTARKNLCGNADVAKYTYGQEVDAACRQVTSEWSKKKCPLFASIDVEDLAAMMQRRGNGSGSGSGSVNNNKNRASSSYNNNNYRGSVAGTGFGRTRNQGQHEYYATTASTKVEVQSENDDTATDEQSLVHLHKKSTTTIQQQRQQQQQLDRMAQGGNAMMRDQSESKLFVPPGVHDVDSLLQLGLNRGVCPYLMSRHAVQFEADIVISSFLYMVDPKVSPAVTAHMPRQTVVILDEGHNVDDVCIEALSMVITRADTSIAREQNIKDLENGINKMKAENRQKLAEEFQRIAIGRDLIIPNNNNNNNNNNQQGQQQQPQQRARGAGDPLEAHQALIPKDILDQAIPAQLRQVHHFLPLLTRIVEFFHRFICRMTFPQVADPLTFLSKVKDECQTDLHALRFVSGRLNVLLQTLEIDDVYKYRHVVLISDFVTTLADHLAQQQQDANGNSSSNLPRKNTSSDGNFSTYKTGNKVATSSQQQQFAIVCEPFDHQNPTVPDPVIQLACLDASLAMKEVFERFDSVVLTSGTLSPLHLPPKMLGFTPVVSRSLPMTLSRKCIAPMIVTRSADQASLEQDDRDGDGDGDASRGFGDDVTLSSSFKIRKDSTVNKHVLQAYASLLKNLAQVVPDGICVFFTGYQYMNEVLTEWNSNGFLKELSELKLIFIETQGVEETAKCLANFRRACDIGRGAIFFSIARGKIAEGIDFDRHYGRAVVMFGVPFLPPVDRALNERLKWMQANLGISDQEYRSFDAMRQASQCIGRVIRNKTDYGLMILVDRRFARPELRRKIPEWISSYIDSNGNLSTESAVTVARRFFREMAQPWDKDTEMGNTLLDFNSLCARGFGSPQQIVKSERRMPLLNSNNNNNNNNNNSSNNSNNNNNNQDYDHQNNGDDVVDVGTVEFRPERAPNTSSSNSQSAGAKKSSGQRRGRD